MGMYGTGYKVPEERRGMKGNARETHGSGCKVPGECRGMQGNARGKGVGAKCQGNAGKCRRMPEEHMGVGAMC